MAKLVHDIVYAYCSLQHANCSLCIPLPFTKRDIPTSSRHVTDNYLDLCATTLQQYTTPIDMVLVGNFVQ